MEVKADQLGDGLFITERVAPSVDADPAKTFTICQALHGLLPKYELDPSGNHSDFIFSLLLYVLT